MHRMKRGQSNPREEQGVSSWIREAIRRLWGAGMEAEKLDGMCRTEHKESRETSQGERPTKWGRHKQAHQLNVWVHELTGRGRQWPAGLVKNLRLEGTAPSHRCTGQGHQQYHQTGRVASFAVQKLRDRISCLKKWAQSCSAMNDKGKRRTTVYFTVPHHKLS